MVWNVFKVNNTNQKTLEQCQQRRSGAFKVEFEHISIFQYFHIHFEQVNVHWDHIIRVYVIKDLLL